jgi:signal transduction histidine kinase
MKELWAVVERVHTETSAAAAREEAAEAVEPDGLVARRQRIAVYIHDFPESERPR